MSRNLDRISLNIARSRYAHSKISASKTSADLAIKNYARIIAERPKKGPLLGAKIDLLFELYYNRIDLYLFITWLAQIHMGRITRGMVIGKANRMGLSCPKSQRKRLLKAGL